MDIFLREQSQMIFHGLIVYPSIRLHVRDLEHEDLDEVVSSIHWLSDLDPTIVQLILVEHESDALSLASSSAHTYLDLLWSAMTYVLISWCHSCHGFATTESIYFRLPRSCRQHIETRSLRPGTISMLAWDTFGALI